MRASAAGAAMFEYRRARHRLVARLLAVLDAGFIATNHCYFGGGTRIALELDEFRESQDIDFLCADIAGYRALRAGISERSLGPILGTARKLPAGITLLRDVRADQYGIRTLIGVDGEPVKFEIILEARIGLTSAQPDNLPVQSLDRVSCFAEKWLANADRWNDASVASRDVIDLAFMLGAWGSSDAQAGAERAASAYGAAIKQSALSACAKIIEGLAYRKQCAGALLIEDAAALLARLRKLQKIAQHLPAWHGD